jgi:HlyD family secretion protein
MNEQTHISAQEIESALGLSGPKRRSRVMKRALLALIVAGLAVGGYYYLSSYRSASTQVSYETLPAKVTDVIVTVSATGTIEPITQVDIGSEASGVVREVLANENDLVKQGSILALLDTTRLIAQQARSQAQVAAAEARLEQGRATLNEAQLTENRQKALRQKGLSTAHEMDAAEAASKRAQAQLAAAYADVSSAKADLAIINADVAKTSILSPINGVVLKRSVEPGQTVAASLQAPVLFQIAQDLTRIQLEAAVDEADIGAVRVGQAATFTVDAYRGRNFPAKIERLSFAPETVDGVVTYKAILSAPNDDLALRPGMTATARITVEEFRQALTVPNEALRYQPPVASQSEGFSITRMFMPRFPQAQRGKNGTSADGTRAVYVLQDGKPAEVRVTLGQSDGKVTVVKEGQLKIDDPMVISQKQASNGAR